MPFRAPFRRFFTCILSKYLHVSLCVIIKVILAGKNSLKSSNEVSGPETVRPKAAGGNPSTNYTITEVQLRAAAAASSDSETSSAISKQPRPKQAVVYTEVKPLKIRNKPAEATPVNCADQQPPQPSSSMNNHANPTHDSNTNIRPSIPTYENIQLQETTNVSNTVVIFSLTEILLSFLSLGYVFYSITHFPWSIFSPLICRPTSVFSDFVFVCLCF